MNSIISNLDALKSAGAKRVLVTSVNDPFVLAAFAKPFAQHAPFLQFLADSDAEFATAINATVDLSAAGLGLRSNRYALVVDGGFIEYQLVEEKPAQLDVTDAKNVVPLLARPLQAAYESQVTDALAQKKYAYVMLYANRMVVKGLRITPIVYSSMVQAAAGIGQPESAEHLVLRWKNDADANFSANDAANCAKWIAAGPKEFQPQNDEALYKELTDLADKIPYIKAP
jgi:hypothetical protein